MIFPFFRKFGTIIILVLLCLVFAIFSPSFRTAVNLLDVLRQISILSLIAAGATLVMIGGEFDLSIGYIAGFTGIITAMMLGAGYGIFLAILAGLSVGILLGTLNGTLVVMGRISAIIATIGTMFLLQGLEHIFSGGTAVLFRTVAPSFTYISNGYLGFIPIPVIIMAIVYSILYIFLRHSRFGYRLYAVGGNLTVASFSGIKVWFYKWIMYLLGAALCAAGGILSTSRAELATLRLGDAYLLDSLAAVFIGMSTIREGEVHILGTFIGVLLIGIVSNGLTLFNIPYVFHSLFRGAVFVLAVSIAYVASGQKNEG